METYAVQRDMPTAAVAAALRAGAAHLAQPQRVQHHLARHILRDFELDCAAASAAAAAREAPREAAAKVRRHRPHEHSPEAGRCALVHQVARDVDPPRESVQLDRRGCRVEGPGRDSVIHRVQRVAESCAVGARSQ
jgi:hypothetical protein